LKNGAPFRKRRLKTLHGGRRTAWGGEKRGNKRTIVFDRTGDRGLEVDLYTKKQGKGEEQIV